MWRGDAGDCAAQVAAAFLRGWWRSSSRVKPSVVVGARATSWSTAAWMAYDGMDDVGRCGGHTMAWTAPSGRDDGGEHRHGHSGVKRRRGMAA